VERIVVPRLFDAGPCSGEKPQVIASGAPGPRTLNQRIKRRPLDRRERTACTNVPRICPESTRRTESPPALVPRAVPRTECRGWRAPLPSVAGSTIPSAAPRPRTPALSLGPCLGSCRGCSGLLCPRTSGRSLASLPVDRPVHGKGKTPARRRDGPAQRGWVKGQRQPEARTCR